MGAPVRQLPPADTADAGGCAQGAGAVLAGIIALLMWSDDNGFGAAAMAALAAVLAVKFFQRRRAHDAAIAQLRAAQSTEIARYHAMNPREFEHAIAFLCQRDGCRHVQVVGGAGDLGADVLALAPDGRRIVIQCKRYGPTTKVGSPDLQRFGGTCYSVHGAHVAAVVTTSTFTRPASQYGTHQGIRLLDGTALAGWATRTGPAPWM
jgi:restriction system protein